MPPVVPVGQVFLTDLHMGGQISFFQSGCHRQHTDGVCVMVTLIIGDDEHGTAPALHRCIAMVTQFHKPDLSAMRATAGAALPCSVPAVIDADCCRSCCGYDRGCCGCSCRSCYGCHTCYGRRYRSCCDSCGLCICSGQTPGSPCIPYCFFCSCVPLPFSPPDSDYQKP